MSKSHTSKFLEEKSINEANANLIKRLESHFDIGKKTYGDDQYRELSKKGTLEKLNNYFEDSIYEAVDKYFKDLGFNLGVSRENIELFKEPSKLKKNIKKVKASLELELDKLTKTEPSNPRVSELNAEIQGLDILINKDDLLKNICDSIHEVKKCAMETAKAVESRDNIRRGNNTTRMTAEEKAMKKKYTNAGLKIAAGFMLVALDIVTIGVSLAACPPLLMPAVIQGVAGAGLIIKGFKEAFSLEKQLKNNIKERDKATKEAIEKMSNKLKAAGKSLQTTQSRIRN